MGSSHKLNTGTLVFITLSAVALGGLVGLAIVNKRHHHHHDDHSHAPAAAATSEQSKSASVEGQPMSFPTL